MAAAKHGATVAYLGAELAAGRTTSRKLIEEALSRIQDSKGEGARAFLKVYADSAREQADASDRLRATGVVRSPVEGIPVSVKDLYDVAGDVTRAGSKALARNPPAKADAVAVARLRAAGAILIGRTNTVEFAFGGVGTNPHYGTPKNPWDRGAARIPGGSSSGAAVSVADGMAVMGLGSDTRGSVRIPAALCGVTGFKSTQARISREGCFPLSYTLDSVGPLANSIACCAIYDSILAGEQASAATVPPPLPLEGLRLLIPRCILFDGLEAPVAAAFERSIETLQSGGAHIVREDVPELTGAMALFDRGGFAAPEAYQIHRPILARHKEDYDSTVAVRIALGESFSAADYIQLGFERKALIEKLSTKLRPFDAMLSPTVPVIAPTIEEVNKDYVKWNMLLIRNPGLINLLDGCAATVPCQQPGEAPVGLQVAGLAGADKHVLAVAQAIELALNSDSTAESERRAKKARL